MGFPIHSQPTIVKNRNVKKSIKTLFHVQIQLKLSVQRIFHRLKNAHHLEVTWGSILYWEMNMSMNKSVNKSTHNNKAKFFLK